MSPPAWRALISETTCSERILVRIGALAVEAPFLAVQQLRQRVPVMHVSWLGHRAMRQRAPTVHTDMHLCSQVPLLAFAGPVHLGVTRVLLILRPARAPLIVAPTMVPLVSFTPLA
jgi:hypothetical protein